MPGNQALDTNCELHVLTLFTSLELISITDPGPYPNEPYIDYSGGLAQLAITTHGSDWYWAVCAVMILSTIVFLGLSLTKRREHRVFHYITAAITMVASIAYFSMASGLGWGKHFSASPFHCRGTLNNIFIHSTHSHRVCPAQHGSWCAHA